MITAPRASCVLGVSHPTASSPTTVRAAQTSASEGDTFLRGSKAQKAVLDCDGSPAVSGSRPHELSASGAKDSPAEPGNGLGDAISKGDVLELAALIGEASPAKKKELLETKNKDGHTPLLQAVVAKQPAAAAMLAYLGADLHAADSKGRTAPFLAAASKDMRALELFVTDKRFSESFFDPLCMTPTRMEKLLATILAKTLTDDVLDATAGLLTGKPRSHFKDAMQLQKYFSHLESFKENPLGVEAAGWMFENFLPLRIRSLLAIAAVPERRAALGDDPTAFKIIATEIANQLEGLRFRNRNTTLAAVTQPALRIRLAALEAAAVRRRLATLPEGVEYSMPGGWVGHAIYINFARREVEGQQVLTMRIDNRGGGSGRHDNDSGTWIYPFVVNIPVAELENAETQETLESLIGDLMLRKVAAPSTDNATLFYDSVDVFRARLIANYGPVAAQAGSRSFDHRSKQTTGNCVVANHQAGLYYRLGEAHSTAITEMEKEMAATRLFEVLQPDVLKAHVAKNRLRIEKVLGEKAG